MAKDPYDILGVAPTASADEIKNAYRRLAMKLHPDMNPGDPSGESRFKDVASAYRLLRDPEKRKRFDAGEIDETGAERPQQRFYRDFAQSGHADGYSSDAGFADFAQGEDPLAELLRRSAHARANRRGPDLHFRLPIALAESIQGAMKRLTMPDGGTARRHDSRGPRRRPDAEAEGQGRPRFRQRGAGRRPDRGGSRARPALHAGG